MADEPQHEIEVGQRAVILPRRSRTVGVLMFIGLLAVMGAAVTYARLNYGALFQTASDAARKAVNGEESATLKDFQSFQQQTADSLKSLADDVATERAELKSLSDQVTALTARIDALKSTATLAPEQPAAPPKPPVIAARKKPTAPKTTGSISVGGAPLPPAPPPD